MVVVLVVVVAVEEEAAASAVVAATMVLRMSTQVYRRLLDPAMRAKEALLSPFFLRLLLKRRCSCPRRPSMAATWEQRLARERRLLLRWLAIVLLWMQEEQRAV